VKVLVDTSVWSLVLRRRVRSRDDAFADELERLIVTYRVVMIGPIRQELLSGIRTYEQYEGLRERLRAFPDLRLHSQDYELAAQFFNQCRGRGVQGSNTDFLICAAAVRRDSSVFSTDRDFEAYERILQLRRHHVGD
jgi:predicted nucleic acid-binding protein